MIRHVLDDPSGLSLRAQRFIREEGERVDTWTAEQHREHWGRHGRPDHIVEQLVQFQARWGGLQLPTVAEYDGGPAYLAGDDPDYCEGIGLCFDAGGTRTALPYSFCVDRSGRFGLVLDEWVPLHGSVEGWVEAAALEHEVMLRSRVRLLEGRRVTGVVDRLSKRLGSLEPVPEVAGLADTWWRGRGVVLAIYTGEAQAFGSSRYQRAYVYEQTS